MFWDRYIEECRKIGKSPNAAAKEIPVSSGTLTHWKTGAVPAGKTLEKVAAYFNVSVDYLMEKPPKFDQIGTYIPYEQRGMRPIIGLASAGNGVLAQENVLGWNPVDAKFDSDNYFWLKVSGDSMSPSIADGDLVLIQRDGKIENNSIAIVIVDDADAFLKQILIKDNAVVLHSINPYYPDRIFAGKEENRLRFAGRARKVERDL